MDGFEEALSSSGIELDESIVSAIYNGKFTATVSIGSVIEGREVKGFAWDLDKRLSAVLFDESTGEISTVQCYPYQQIGSGASTGSVSWSGYGWKGYGRY